MIPNEHVSIFLFGVISGVIIAAIIAQIIKYKK